MPIAYRVKEDGSIHHEVLTRLDDSVVWIDALAPTDTDLAQLDALMGFEVPNRHDIAEIELSSRLYREEGALVMIASLLPKSTRRASPPRPAAFIMRKNLLLTIRYYEFFSFERVARELPVSEDPVTPGLVFIRLLEEAVADRADNLEYAMRSMEDLTSRLFLHQLPQSETPAESPELDAALAHIGSVGERVSNIRESIASLQRVVNFAQTYTPSDWFGSNRIVLGSVKSDLVALSDEAGFFMNKLSFNLDATLGMINIEESKIIRFLSTVTLLLSPPTLIAGIYGMNFAVMPELQWPHGYLFSLALMGMTATASIWYLKRKKWL
ncbi:MAG: hypothetical protein LIP23_04245 [Planctomycetes bacterium]|nr:hypothetical protein [Planctomycetota bacterium]